MLLRRHPRRRPLALAAVAALVGAFAVGVGGAAPARAATQEVHFPVNGAFAFSGLGYGHGHGMSQWGADGAATQGLSASQILDFYYPGTATGSVPNSVLRVSLSGIAGGVSVVPTTRSGALSAIRDDQPTTPLALPATVNNAPVTQWAVTSTGGVQSLVGYWSGAWQAYPTTAPWTSSSAMGFRGANGLVSAQRSDGTVRDYFGDLVLQSAGGLAAVDRVPLESYLRSVTPSESPSSWPAAALQAQAIAARTYAVYVSSPGRPYDICDTTACQVYNGIASYDAGGSLIRSYQAASTDSAVAATVGQVRTYNGAPIFAQFFAADGGWTVAGGQPYLIAQPDPYDGVVPNYAHSWSKTLSAQSVGAATGVGVATEIVVNSRDGNGTWGGRTTSVTVFGTTSTVTLTGTGFAGATGLMSPWWNLPVGSPPNPQLEGVNLYAIRATGSGSGQLDLHELTAASNYQTFARHNITGMPQRPTSDWTYLVAPYKGDGQPDLYSICLRACGSGHIEVHVLSASSNYQTFLAHIATGAPEIAASYDPQVRLASYAGDGQEDLFLMMDANTGSGMTEVHVLSAASNYQTFVAHIATALGEAGSGQHWTYLVGDAAGNGDLVAVHDSGTTGSGYTEVHVLSEVSGYQSFSAHDATPLMLGSGATFALGSASGGAPDLYVLLPLGASNEAEVHVLSVASAYATWTAHIATAVAATPPSDWALALGC